MIRATSCVCIALAGCGRVAFDHVPLQADADADADAAAKASRCGTLAGELFCESFEGDPRLTTVEATAPGFVRVDELRAVAGRRSLHARTSGASLEPAWVLGGVLPDVTSGDLYARWYIYLPSSVTNAQLASVHIVDAMTPFPGFVVGVRDGLLDIVSSKDGDYALSAVVAPRDRWACVQLHVTVSATAGVVESWLDGVSTATLTGIDTAPNVSLRNLHAGVFATGFTTEPQELWTDEVAVATQSIACD